jgi:5-formyltetrahydrofolate cyclo-ligase
VQPGEIDLFIVPGLAFDPHCNRIGFGKGYYDDLLAGAPDAIKIALAYDFQMVDKIQAEKHDVKMDMVVTPQKVFRRKRG